MVYGALSLFLPEFLDYRLNAIGIINIHREKISVFCPNMKSFYSRHKV